MKRFGAFLIAAVMLAIPSMASAHTGSVTCNSTGVVFSYNNNFAHNTNVTEFVKDSTQGNGNIYSVVVPAHTAFTSTVSAPSASVVASANWVDGNLKGSIAPVTLNCPVTPPTPNPPIECPGGTTPDELNSAPNTMVCIRVVQLPAPPPVVVTSPPTNTVTTITKIKWKTRPPKFGKTPKCEVGKRVKVFYNGSTRTVICVQQVKPPVHHKVAGATAG